MQELAGTVGVVTGAGSGIGRALAVRLAAADVRVAVLDIDGDAAGDVAAEITAAGGTALPVPCDVSLRAEVCACADRVFEHFGAVHILCNIAGVTCFKPVTDMTDDDWDWMLGVDLMSVVYAYQAYLPRMLAQGAAGHVVNMSSGVGVVPDLLPDHTAYAAAKSGVVGLSASLRTELAGTGIGVSVVCPGMVRTEILRSRRVRPSRYGGGEDVTEAVPGRPDILRDAMDPLLVADLVLDAIRADRPFVFTHDKTREQVREYYQRMLADS